MLLNLSQRFTYEGQFFGPGPVEVENEEIAKSLQSRDNKLRREKVAMAPISEVTYNQTDGGKPLMEEINADGSGDLRNPDAPNDDTSPGGLGGDVNNDTTLGGEGDDKKKSDEGDDKKKSDEGDDKKKSDEGDDKKKPAAATTPPKPKK